MFITTIELERKLNLTFEANRTWRKYKYPELKPQYDQCKGSNLTGITRLDN